MLTLTLGATQARASLIGDKESSPDRLVSFDTSTGAATEIGPVGSFVACCSLAYEASTGTLFGAEVSTPSLITIDPNTANPTFVAPLSRSVFALDFHPGTGVLYGSDAFNLVTVNTSTGAVTTVGSFNTGGPAVNGLAFHSGVTRLFGTDAINNQLLRINLSTGQTTVVGPFGISGIAAIAYDNASGVLYGHANQINNGRLVTINPTTGAATVVGPSSVSIVHDLTVIPSAVPEPGTVALFGCGLAGVAILVRRRSPGVRR